METETQPKTSSCLKCKSDVAITIKFCTSCGYPQHGTAKDKNNFRIRKRIQETKLREEELAATVGKSVLFILGFFYLAWALYTNLIVYETDAFYLGVDLIEAFIFISLAFWARKKLLAATIGGLLFFTTMFVIGVVINPYSALLISFKSIFFILLIVSVTSARKYEKLKREFE